MVAQIKKDRDTAIQKEVFDLAMKRITGLAEVEMVNIELKNIISKYGKEIDIKSIGLNLNETIDNL